LKATPIEPSKKLRTALYSIFIVEKNQEITDHDFVIVDITESEIEHPKQTN